jgi:hypothetical protein
MCKNRASRPETPKLLNRSGESGRLDRNTVVARIERTDIAPAARAFQQERQSGLLII